MAQSRKRSSSKPSLFTRLKHNSQIICKQIITNIDLFFGTSKNHDGFADIFFFRKERLFSFDP
jgi:hypothetical protein